MTFNISDVKTVLELYEEKEVNSKLGNGWVLLSVGFDTVDGVACKVYILGNTSVIDPYKLPHDSKLAKLINQ